MMPAAGRSTGKRVTTGNYIPPAAARPHATGWLARIADAGGLRLAILAAIALFAFLPGLTELPPLDRDEPRFAQASRQMLETGDFVDIRFQEEARHKKPVGIYWMQTAVVSAASALGMEDATARIWLYRLPSQLGAVLSVLLLAWAGAPLVGRHAAFLAATALALTILLGVEARLAKTDAMILATVLLAHGILIRAYLRDDPGRKLDWGSAVAFWGAIGLGVLIKGPVTPLFIALTTVAASFFQRDWRWLRGLRPVPGLLIVLAMAAPWFIAITLQSNGAFFQESVGQDMLGKIFEGQEKHGAPPGAYLLTIWGTLWPVSPFLLLALPAIWRWRRERETRFLIAWAGPAWALFELIPTKLPHYILPIVPALMLLTARFLLAPEAYPRWLRWPAIILLLVGSAGVPIAALAGGHLLDGLPSVRFVLFGLAAAALGIWAVAGIVRAQLLPAFMRAGASALVLYAGIYGFAFPEMRTIWPARSLAQAARLAPCSEPRLATAGFREPSLVFQTRTDLVMTDGKGAAAFLGEGGCRVAFVEVRERENFEQVSARDGVPARLLTRVKGFNINGGRMLDIGVYSVSEQRP